MKNNLKQRHLNLIFTISYYTGRVVLEVRDFLVWMSTGRVVPLYYGMLYEMVIKVLNTFNTINCYLIYNRIFVLQNISSPREQVLSPFIIVKKKYKDIEIIRSFALCKFSKNHVLGKLETKWRRMTAYKINSMGSGILGKFSGWLVYIYFFSNSMGLWILLKSNSVGHA